MHSLSGDKITPDTKKGKDRKTPVSGKERIQARVQKVLAGIDLLTKNVTGTSGAYYGLSKKEKDGILVALEERVNNFRTVIAQESTVEKTVDFSFDNLPVRTEMEGEEI